MRKVDIYFVATALMACLLGHSGSYEINMTRYFKMPKLIELDDYDRCMQEFDKTPARYCFVRAEIIEPEEDEAAKDIWHTITEISQYRRHHFDHRQLNFGLCMRWCEAALADLDDVALRALDAGILTNNSKINIYLALFSGENSNRLEYNKLANRCINLRLQKKYQLSAKTVIGYCDTNRLEIVEDAWNQLFYVIVYVILTLMTLSTLYDFYLKQRRSDKVLTSRDHYKSPINKISDGCLVAFSIPRNWYRLNQDPGGKVGRDLRFLDCLKFFAMFLVVFAHSNYSLYELGISNPQDSERLLHTLSGSFIISGNLITVTFFVIGGFLLTINWILYTKEGKELTLFTAIINFVLFNIIRYIRLTGPYAFAILLSGVYFESARGPLWRHVYEREQLACRKNWWANLLYVNNFVNTDERCLLQGWYLATDAQGFMFSLILLSIANRWPKIRKLLFGFILGLTIVLSGVVTKLKGYFPMYVATPQTQRDSFIGDREFAEFYSTPYMNFGCYFAGVIGAYVYHEISERQFNLRSYKIFQIIWYGLFPAAIFWLMLAHPIYQNLDHSTNTIWDIIFSCVQRNAWGIGLSFFIVGMAAKVGWIFHKFCCLPIFRILGRLTYGTFVLHLVVARIVIATLREPIFFGPGTMFAFIFYTMAGSYLAALVLAMMVELPVSAFMKLAR